MILNLHRHVVVVVVTVVVVVVYKNNEKNTKVKMEHATNKTSICNNNKTTTYIKYWKKKIQHPRKTGQLIRKYHKLLQNLFQ
jgi:hypothetical protein